MTKEYVIYESRYLKRPTPPKPAGDIPRGVRVLARGTRTEMQCTYLRLTGFETTADDIEAELLANEGTRS